MKKLSKKEAKKFFQEYHLPRRVRNIEKEEITRLKKDKRKRYYRRVLAHEEDRGELYPVWKAGIRTFADFGIGMGIYFTQLIVLAVVSLISGAILVLGSGEYARDYGITDKSDELMSVTAACPSPQNVTATLGCPNSNYNCSALYVPNCELPRNVIIADLTMSLIFAFAIFASKLLENKIQERLDEIVQTASDYSVEVLDPESDADNPDEWYEFFSRFGSVRYVAIIRKNEKVVYNCFDKHKILHKLRILQKELDELSLVTSESEEGKTFQQNESGVVQQQQVLNQIRQRELINKIKRLHIRLDKIETTLGKLYIRNYRVCRVYVTFENEEEQRLCLQSLEVPDIYAILDIRDLSNMKNLFRGSNVLNVIEPVEPDNVLWEHLAYENTNKQISRIILSYALTILTFTAVWYAIAAAEGLGDSFTLGVVIAVFDSFLPMLFETFTDITLPASESKKQLDLQLRLFLARLLLSTLVPYLQTNWNQTLSRAFIEQIIIVQVSASFITPFISFLDLGNAIRRNFSAYYQSDTQEELNLKWSGSEWSIAEKYTGIAKVLFVSLYYAILVPYSILIAMCAFLFMFFIDRYLLLRKWKISPMLDETVAVRLRQQAILAVAAHMFVTMRFISSWPMDEVWYHKDTNVYEKVNKSPSWNVLHYEIYDWQNEAQREYIVYYYIGMVIVFALTLYVWIIVPFGSAFYRLFCYNLRVIGDSQDIPFSTISNNMTIYEPQYPFRETKFLCSHLIDVLPEHRPTFVTAYDHKNHDISYYVPEIHRPHVLSIVKYYSKEFEEQYQKGLPSNAIPSSQPKNSMRGRGSSALVSSENDDTIDIELVEMGDGKIGSTPRAAIPTRPSKPVGNMLRRSYFEPNPYESLPLHVELDNRTAPSERVAGSIPEELRKKIASREVQPTTTTSSNNQRPGSRFSNRRSQNLMKGNAETDRDDMSEGKTLFRRSLGKISPNISDSPPKQNFRKQYR